MKKLLLAVMPIALCAAVPAARADETGLAAIHEMRYEHGHKICMSDHFHDGSGNGQTRKQAESAAIGSWASFTSFEYGSSWGSYALAADRKMDCHENGAKAWACLTTARPCMRYAGPVRRSGSRAASR